MIQKRLANNAWKKQKINFLLKFFFHMMAALQKKNDLAHCLDKVEEQVKSVCNVF